MYFQTDLLSFQLNANAKELLPKTYIFGYIEYLSWAYQKLSCDKNVVLSHTYNIRYHSFLYLK